MYPYGEKVKDLKKSVITYITQKLKGDEHQTVYPLFLHFRMSNGLEDFTVEELCDMADKIHFHPIKSLITKNNNNGAFI